MRTGLILGSSGSVGTWIRATLNNDVDKWIGVDLRASVQSPMFVDDAVNPSQETLNAARRSEVIVIALPESAALESLEWLSTTVTPSTLVVATSSVQLALHAAAERRTLALQGLVPLYSPNLSPVGRPVAIIGKDAGGASTKLLAGRIEDAGGSAHHFTPSAYDETMSFLQTSIHALALSFGTALANSPIEAADAMRLAPPPARLLLVLLCRMLSAPQEVYRDIQFGNTFAPMRRSELSGILGAWDSEDAAGTPWLEQWAVLQEYFATVKDDGAKDCQSLFEKMLEQSEERE